jgi:hypothetical protein
VPSWPCSRRRPCSQLTSLAAPFDAFRDPFMVIMGMNNRQTVSLSLPPILPKAQKLPAAFMYFAFFAVGALSGTMLTGGKKGGSSGKSKSQN